MKNLRNASRVGRLAFLTEDDKRDFYRAALEILATVGMKVHHEGARAMLLEDLEAGCTLTPEQRVLMPRRLVKHARLSEPSVVNVHDRDGELAMERGGNNSCFGYLTGSMCAVEMAKWLDIPNWGNAGTSDSHALDAQAGMEATQITFLAMQAGSNLAHDVGYLDFGLTCSLEEIVVVDEFIAMNRRLLGGIEVDRETLAVEVIAKAGPGGNFMTSKHTRRHMREVRWRPTILNRQGREGWLADGAPDLAARARLKAMELLATHKAPSLPPQVAAKAGELIAGFVAATA